MTDGSASLDRPLSASKLKTFAECPERFYHQYVARTPPAAPDDNVYTRMGSAVHDAIETVLRRGDAIDDAATIQTRLKAAYRRGEYDFAAAEDLPGGEDPHRKVLRCLDTAGRFLAAKVDTVRGIELPYRLDLQPVDHPLSGYIDLATDAAVVDWKTGSSSDDDDDDEGATDDEILQAAPYMAGYAAVFGEPPAKVQYVYLADEEVQTLAADDALWDEMVAVAERLLAAVDTGSFPGTPETANCYWCDFKPHCTTYQNGAGGVDWEVYP